jgi:hypothetical protein
VYPPSGVRPPDASQAASCRRDPFDGTTGRSIWTYPARLTVSCPADTPGFPRAVRSGSGPRRMSAGRVNRCVRISVTRIGGVCVRAMPAAGAVSARQPLSLAFNLCCPRGNSLLVLSGVSP